MAEMLTLAEEQDLVARAKAGDAKSLDRLVARHMPLVKSLAGRYARPGIEEDDLTQAGAEAMLHAWRRYTPGVVRFGVYAKSWVRGAMLRHIEDNLSLLGVGGRAWRRVVNGAVPETDEERTLAVIARSGEVGLDEPRLDGDGQGRTLADVLPADDPLPDEIVERNELVAAMLGAIGSLSEHEYLVVAERWLADNPKGYKAVAGLIDLTPYHVRQLEEQALEAIGKRMKATGEARRPQGPPKDR